MSINTTGATNTDVYFLGNLYSDYIFAVTSSIGINIDSLIIKNGQITGNIQGDITSTGTSIFSGSTVNFTGATVLMTGTSNVVEATQLATSGAPVIINATNPPTTGQVLKATSATAATWQDESGGGGGTFGSEWERNTDPNHELVSTTTSTSYQTKVAFTTASKPTGTYRISWYYEYNNSSTSYDFMGRVQLDGSTIQETRHEPKDSSGSGFGGSNQSFPCAGFYVTTFGSTTTHTINVQYRTESSSTAAIRRARVEIFRIS